jgi:lipopolysaccharide biosynthesis protein
LPRQWHLAFYLPQFHPIPENDAWWGLGFTEWTNVAAARPLFRGHYQPHIPADLGFYDLRTPETRMAQAELATQYGIDGFCYYHYWFGGKRLLERPFDEVLRSGEPSIPFCLAWANENWTRRWDGFEHEILMRQDYEKNEDEHAQWLAKAFRDERYIRIDGRPLFLVYRARQLPDPVRTTRLWRDEARAAGVGEIFLCCVEAHSDERVDPASIGFDAAVEFAPDFSILANSREMRRYEAARRLPWLGSRSLAVFDYERVMAAMLAKPPPRYTRFPCVTPGFDNSSRRHEPVILTKSTPEAYRRWVEHAARHAPRSPGGDSLVFVNAWNEWGEGAHLEPCQRWGRGYLEAHRDARAAVDTGPPIAEPT